VLRVFENMFLMCVSVHICNWLNVQMSEQKSRSKAKLTL